MVLKIDVSGEHDVISLHEFVENVSDVAGDFEDSESLLRCAPWLKRLANNRTFFAEAIFGELSDLSSFQQRNIYGPSVFMLHTCDRFFVRANVWKPISALEGRIPGFRYDICHDHNFDILTVGYSGPGYRAQTYTYDSNRVDGLLGETVDMVSTGIVTLGQGDVMIYRAKKDIHIQMPPESLSVSLNLIPRNSWIDQPQYQFDEERRVICRYLHNSGSELIVRMASVIGADDTAQMLNSVRRGSPHPHIRALAAVSEARLREESNNDINSWLRDSGRLENFIFHLENDSPGSSLRLLP